MELRRVLFVSVAFAAAAACGKGVEPSGQVVATVDGREITAQQLRVELGGFTSSDPKQRRAAEQAALQQIVVRTALAEAAKKHKIDKTPEFAQAAERQTQDLLVQTWQNRIARSIPSPNQTEAQRYVAEHPELYSGRMILTVEQIRTFSVPTADLMSRLQPLTTLEQVVAVLQATRTPFRRMTGEIDPMTLDSAVAAKVAKLPPQEVFIIPAEGYMTINKVVEARPAAVPQEVAEKNALERLRAERAAQAVQRQFGADFQEYRSKISYAKGYEPSATSGAPALKQR